MIISGAQASKGSESSLRFKVNEYDGYIVESKTAIIYLEKMKFILLRSGINNYRVCV